MDAAFTIRLTSEEHTKLEALAELDHVSKSHIIRVGLRSLYAQRFPEKKVKRG